MDKILYTGGPNPFKGLIGMPEKPDRNDFGDSQREGFRATEFFRAEDRYEQQVESIKSNAPDIVNITELPGLKQSVTPEGWYWSYENKNPKLLKPGDIFDLPVGYEFKKEDQFDGWEGPEDDRYPKYKIVLRIIKSEPTISAGEANRLIAKMLSLEPEESHKELEVLNSIRGDNETFHSMFDKLIKERLRKFDPEFVKKMEEIAKDVEFWYA